MTTTQYLGDDMLIELSAFIQWFGSKCSLFISRISAGTPLEVDLQMVLQNSQPQTHAYLTHNQYILLLVITRGVTSTWLYIFHIGFQAYCICLRNWYIIGTISDVSCFVTLQLSYINIVLIKYRLREYSKRIHIQFMKNSSYNFLSLTEWNEKRTSFLRVKELPSE